MKLTHHQYGKARVRVLRILRRGKIHTLKELNIAVALQGDFDASYTKADNRLVIATDSMKNTVNVLAKKHLGPDTEPFGILLAEHFLHTYPHVHCAEITISERRWDRLTIAGKPRPHSFTEGAGGRPTAKITSTRIKKAIRTHIESGLEDLLILKSTASAFENFLRDDFTTLPETADRILATKLKATWSYAKHPPGFTTTNGKIVSAMLAAFAKNFSPSVQVTLFEMGEAALKSAPEISKIHLALPNKHYLLINLAPFGLENKNELFVPTDEPHGQIEGTIER